MLVAATILTSTGGKGPTESSNLQFRGAEENCRPATPARTFYKRKPPRKGKSSTSSVGTKMHKAAYFYPGARTASNDPAEYWSAVRDGQRLRNPGFNER